MGDRDYEWPTFDDTDNRVSYSPDTDREKIFTEFKLAKDSERGRNKKTKPKEKATLRLTSESEVLGNRYKGRDLKKCLVIGVLVACIIIIIGIAIGLGVYFGVFNKSGESQPDAQASQDGTAIVTVETMSSSSSSSTTTKLPTPSPTSSSTKRSTTKSTSSTTSSSTSTSTSTTTSTTTPTTTTTTTTTTTPPPTKPPTVMYSKADEMLLVDSGKKCWDTNMFSYSSGMTKDEKCRLFGDVLQCLYFDLLKQRIQCPVNVMVEAVQNNSQNIIPAWTGFQPSICKDMTGSVNVGNVSVLPEDKDSLCTSLDAVMYYGKQSCYTQFSTTQLQSETEENKCKLYWSYIGCIAIQLDCLYTDISHLLEISSEQLSTGANNFNMADQTSCQAFNGTLYQSDSDDAACSLQVYQTGSLIMEECSSVIEVSALVSDNTQLKCKLYDEFTLCVDRLITYPCSTSTLKSVGYEIASLESRLTELYTKPLMNISSCGGFVQGSTDICNADSELLVVIVDSRCHEFLLYTSPTRVCENLVKYINCGISIVRKVHRETCTYEQIHEAVKQQADLLKTYNVDVTSCS